MRRLVTALAFGASVCLSATGASAGVYADDLGKCLVAKTSPADQKQLVIWIFAAMSAHPDVKQYSNFTDAQRAASMRGAGALLQRLLIEDCRAATVLALKNEGSGAIEPAFGVLGQVAMRGLMSHPDVETSMGELTAGIDNSKFEALMKEAGVPVK